jgi:hypothetical protein
MKRNGRLISMLWSPRRQTTTSSLKTTPCGCWKSPSSLAERENLHHHRWPSLMVVLAGPNYRNFDADGNEIPPSGGTPASPALPRALRLPPQPLHAIEVAADAPHGFRGIRVEFKTPQA